ncbi:MAG: hypothetical protein ACOVP4_09135 [Bacteriovoracaceae bacterium]
MGLKTYLFILFSLLSFSAWAQLKANGREVNVSSIGFNVGSLTEFVGKVQIDSNGKKRTIDFNPTIGAQAVMPLPFYSLELLPEVNWILPRKTGEDKVYKNLFMFRADLGYRPLDWLRLRAGSSIMFLNTHGSGGKVSRDNGNGQTEFYRPDSNSSSFNNTVDLGIEALYQDFGFRLQTYTYSLFDSDRRQHSYMLMGTYYWDHKNQKKKK